MTGLRSALARACLRLYPSAWRDRYGDELLALFDDAGGGLGDLVDLALGGLRRRAEPRPGGGAMSPRVNQKVAAVAAIAALVVVSPTALFIGMNLFGLPVTWLSGIQLPGGLPMGGDRFGWVPILPALALLIAIAPAVRIERPREGSQGSVLTVRVLAMPRWLVYAGFVCAVVTGAVIAYGLSENVLEALR